MEKYYKIINEIESIRGLKNAFTVDYMKYTDSIFLNFYNMKALKTLEIRHKSSFKSQYRLFNKQGCGDTLAPLATTL